MRTPSTSKSVTAFPCPSTTQPLSRGGRTSSTRAWVSPPCTSPVFTFQPGRNTDTS